MNTVTETRAHWREPTMVRETLSAENKRKQEARRAIENRNLNTELLSTDVDHFERIFRELTDEA